MDIDYDNWGDALDDDQDLFKEDAEEEREEDIISEIDPDETEEGIDNNLQMYLKSIEDKLQEGKIDDYTFALEALLVEYKRALIFRRFNITDDIDKQKILRIRLLRKELEEDVLKDNIEEFDFNRKYYNLLNLEYKLLLKYEDYSLKSKKVKESLTKTFDENINTLIKSELTILKNIAKEKNIEWPNKPDIKKSESKISKLKKYMTYHMEVEKASYLAKQYIPGYKLRTIEKTTKYDSDVSWTIDTPNELKFNQLYKEHLQEPKQSYIIGDAIEDLKINAIKDVLKTKTRDELLSCITEEDVVKKLSYIERLKLNKIPVMKFRKYPGTYEKIKELLDEEAKYYKISENDLMKDFNKKFFDVTPNINLTESPKRFNPVLTVKTNDGYDRSEVPEFFRKGKEKYEIDPSKKGYSFLLKIKQIPSDKKQNIYSEYAEKGSVATISLKPEYFKSDKVSTDIVDEKYYNIIKPLPDDLYQELKAKQLPSNKTDLIEVYELHIPVTELFKGEEKTVKLVRRYENFNDYLTDLLKILEENAPVLENKGAFVSADILYTNIKKIKKYLNTGIDPEYEISGAYSLDTSISKNPIIKKQREIGLNRLREYIFEFYPDNEELVEVLENCIFTFNNKNYIMNVDKIIFIFSEFDESLPNYINGEITFEQLIGIELPFVEPVNDLPNYYSDPKASLKYLYAWNPKQEYLLKYKNELLHLRGSLIKFKENHSDLSDLEINEIYSEFIEHRQWERSKLKLNTLNIPKKKDPIRVMLKFLKKERNKLMSRRIFRVAKINERITVRDDLFRIFVKCKIFDSEGKEFTKKNIRILCQSIENIIYSYSTKPYAYTENVVLVKNSYSQICKLITEPKVIVPVITEFIIKEGDINNINIVRLNKIIETLDTEDDKLILQLLKSMREEELEAYQKALIEQQNQEPTNYKKLLISTINKVIDENKQEKRELMYSIAAQTYIAPVVTNIIPKVYHGPDRFYTPEYLIIGDNQYIYGGNYPDFINPETGNRNYTDDDIYSLAVLFQIDYKEDIEIKTLYKECMEKLNSFSKGNEQIYSKSVFTNYNPTLVSKKIYTSYINYTYRPRKGVKLPGEVYIVYQDLIEVSYAVPFKYNDAGIPVYSKLFLDAEISKHYYIEGPAEFEDIDRTQLYTGLKPETMGSDPTFLTSTKYILVEYKDQYNKTQLFREGVHLKNVKRSPKELFDACNRFTDEISCNDINSYGIDKMKCRFIKGKCKSIIEEIKEKPIIDLDIEKVKFTRTLSKPDKYGKYKEVSDYNKLKLWNSAVKKAKDYITQLIVAKKLNVEEIKIVSEQQKDRLFEYYQFLLDFKYEKTKLEPISEDTNYSNLKELIDYLVPEGPEGLEGPEGPEGPEGKEEQGDTMDQIVKYTNIHLPYVVLKHEIYPLRQLKLGNKYLLPDNNIATLLEKKIEERNKFTVTLLIFDNGETYESNKVNIRSIIKKEFIKQKTFKITNDNLTLIKNPPKLFTYNIIEKEYKVENKNIKIKEINKKVYDIPLDILYITYLEEVSKDNKLEVDVITTDMIYKSMGKVLLGIYSKDKNDLLESKNIYPATLDAKIYALKYTVDLELLSKSIKGEIQLQDVINYFNKVLPVVKTITQELIMQLEYGILNKDYKLLERYVKKVEKQKINDENEILMKLYQEANDLLIEKEDLDKKIKQEKGTENLKEIKKVKDEVPIQTPVKMTYTVSKRKKKKQEEED